MEGDLKPRIADAAMARQKQPTPGANGEVKFSGDDAAKPQRTLRQMRGDKVGGGETDPSKRTLRDMKKDRGGGSEGIIKEQQAEQSGDSKVPMGGALAESKGPADETRAAEAIDGALLQNIYDNKLYEKPEVRDALELLMDAIKRDTGVREAFVHLQDAAAKEGASPLPLSPSEKGAPFCPRQNDCSKPHDAEK